MKLGGVQGWLLPIVMVKSLDKSLHKLLIKCNLHPSPEGVGLYRWTLMALNVGVHVGVIVFGSSGLINPLMYGSYSLLYS